jgi:DNA polymerase-3 subunit alpha
MASAARSGDLASAAGNGERAGGSIDDAPIVTQYEMHGVEDLGLLKMDFLGLRNLDVLEITLDLIRESTGVRPDIDAVALDDPKTFEMLQRGETIGVFQLEGGPMRALLRSLRPTRFEDIAALVALYRPGPMGTNMHNDYADRKNGRKPITYIHDDLAPLLADTQGLMIYQESVMRVAQKFAGYSLEEADNLRKAAGKKVRSIMAEEREKFEASCEQTGYGKKLGKQLFDIIEPFADYAFNKSHSYGYGYIAYQTAYLKAHYPVEYFASLLTSVKANLDRAAVYLAECRAMGVRVLNPDINVSASDFIALEPKDAPPGLDLPADSRGVIPFGLSAVRNVGEGLVELVIREREEHGPFTDFQSFVDRVDFTVLNKRTVESLIKAGAFDSLGYRRKGLLQAYELIIDQSVARRRREAEGQFDLFAALEGTAASHDRIEIADVEFDKLERLAFEKEMLGLYVSDHPLLGAERTLRRKVDCTIAEVLEREDGALATVGGVVTNLQRKFTKKGDPMAVFVLEDLQSSVEVMVFPKTMLDHGYKLQPDAIVTVKGRLDAREDTPKLMCLELAVVEGIRDDAPPLRIKLPALSLSEERIGTLKRLLNEHPGESQVFLHIGDGKVLRLADDYCVDLPRVVGELRVAFGHDAVGL